MHGEGRIDFVGTGKEGSILSSTNRRFLSEKKYLFVYFILQFKTKLNKWPRANLFSNKIDTI